MLSWFPADVPSILPFYDRVCLERLRKNAVFFVVNLCKLRDVFYHSFIYGNFTREISDRKDAIQMAISIEIAFFEHRSLRINTK